MRSINKIVMLITALSLTITSGYAAIKNAKTQTLKVYGNCDMCKSKIEEAANKKNMVKAEWNKDSKMLSVTYDSKQTSPDEVLKRVAYAGYDNEIYMAPDDAFAKLPGCCQYERRAGAHPTATIEQKKDSLQDTVKKNSPLSEVLSSYFALKDALAKDDGNTASKEAKVLYKAIDNAPMDKMTPEQHTVWMKWQHKLSYDAEHIKGVTETEHQREHFVSLSKNMYEVVKVFKMDTPVYYDYCPMANDGKGANWLSLQEKISNPYMGKKMLTCGKVQETITK